MRLLPALAACLLFALVPEAALAQAPPSAGLQAWYRADQGVFSDVGCTTVSNDGDAVLCWEDQSGNGLTLTRRGTASPTLDATAVNALPAVEFDANLGLSSVATSLLATTEATVYVVTNTPEGTQAVVNVAQPGSVSEEFLLYAQTAIHSTGEGRFSQRLGTCATNGFYMQGGVFGQAATDLENYVNGVQNRQPLVIIGGPQPYAAVNRAVVLGSRSRFLAVEASTSEIAEVLVYDRKLTEAERLQVEAYLADKYAFSPIAGDAPFPSTNLALWLRGDGCLQTDAGGNVETWFDESGNGYDATQPTAAQQPMLDPDGIGGSHPAVLFDGTDDYLSLGDVLDDVIAGTDSQFSLFAVAYSDVGDNDIIIGKSAALNGDANRAYLARYLSGAFGVQSEYTLGSGNFTRENTTAQQVGCAHAFSATYDGSLDSNGGLDRNTIWVDGVEAATTSASGGTLGDIQDGPGPLAVGAVANASGAAGAFMEGLIAEILLFDGVLTPADRQSVETYLLNKYGIAPAGCVLPVELTGFRARLDGATARLTWETGSETNNAGFAVEHRVPEETEFAEAGFVPGAGTTDTPQAYTFALHDLMPGTHAFRLRQTDFDGAASYSGEVEVAVSLQGALALGAFPNPAASGTTVVTLALAQSGPATVALFDALGRRVATLHEGEVPEGAVLRLAVPELPAGTYLVRASTPGAALTRTITVVR